MFIQTLDTPNPNSMKFVFEDPAYNNDSTATYTMENTTTQFAKDIFETHGVSGLYITKDFITITKIESENWDIIKPQILHVLLEYLVQSKPLLDTVGGSTENRTDLSNLSEIDKQIVDLIEERVRPAVAMDGGDIEFVKYDQESGIVYLRMHGACSGCPSSSATLQNGVKRMLQHYIPEIYDVASV